MIPIEKKEYDIFCYFFSFSSYALAMTVLRVKSFTNSNLKEASKDHPLIVDGISLPLVKPCSVRVVVW